MPTFCLALSVLLGLLQIDSITDVADSLPEERIAAYEQLIDQQTDQYTVAKARMELGIQYHNLSFHDKALDQYNLALGTYRDLNDSSGIYDALSRIAESYAMVQEFENALNYALDAEYYVSDPQIKKAATHRLGYLYFNLNQMDSAEKYFRMAVQQYEATNSVPVSSLLMLAGLNINEGKYEVALNDMLSLEKMGIESGSLTSKYYTYNFISALYHKLGNQDLAQRYRKKRDSLHVTLDQVRSPLDFLETNVIADTLADDYAGALEKQRLYINELKKFYKNDLSTQLANYQKLYELQEKEGQIELLEKENQLYELRQQESRSYLVMLFLGVVILSLVVLLGYRILIIRNRTNKELKNLNDHISKQREDLEGKNVLLKRTIKELKGTQSQLIQSEKMASIGSFVSGVAHELNNPINILNGGLQVIERNLKEMELDEDKHNDLVEDINVMLKESSFSITKINRIIQALIIASYTDQTPVEVDFTEIVDNVKLALREETKKSTVKFMQEVESVTFKCFPNRIHHALKAVLENAFYYAELQQSGPEHFVKVEVRVENNELIVSVENSGPPIPEEDLLKIFDPFYSTKDDGESPGLGLYFAFSAVKEHHGVIRASNTSGGVRFEMRFPK